MERILLSIATNAILVTFYMIIVPAIFVAILYDRCFSDLRRYRYKDKMHSS